jgi:hypothetical protein
MCTLNSPDIEFTDTLHNLDLNPLDTIVQNVGNIYISSNYGDIRIKTSSPTISSNASGFNHVSITNVSSNGNTTGYGKKLCAGLYYNDWLVDDAGSVF